jgi:DeoR family transcriptional regulator, suf operon transcriptional repressor
MPDATVSPAGLRIVKLLVGNRPRTVADLIDDAGVTRTAVTEQLNELVENGFVQRSTERLAGRGRPRHLYSATQAALLLLFADNQRLVVPTIWEAIRQSGGETLVDDVLQRVSCMLAEHYSSKIKAQEPAARLREMTKLLEDEGAVVEVSEENGQLVLYKRSCPFIAMADERGVVCVLDQNMMSAVVGRPVTRTACRREGDPCCTFEIAR